MARCKPDRIVSSDCNNNPTTGKVNMLDTGKLHGAPPDGPVGKITDLGDGPLPDFLGDKDAVTQFCPGCASAAHVLDKLKAFLLSLPDAVIPSDAMVQMTFTDWKRIQAVLKEAHDLVEELEGLRL